MLKRLSAAVVVNYRLMPDRNGEVKPTPLTAQEIQQINNLVRETMGYNTERGDTLNVVNAAFAGNAPPASLQEKVVDYVSSNATDLVKYVLLAIAVLYLLFGVVRPIVRDVLKPAKGDKGQPGAAGEEAGGVPGRLLAVAREEGEAGAAAVEEANLDPRELQRRQYMSNLEAARELVKADPRMAAQIIKEWISSDE